MALSLLSPGTAQVFVKLHDVPLRRKNTCSPRKYSTVRGDGRHRYYWPTPMRLVKKGVILNSEKLCRF